MDVKIRKLKATDMFKLSVIISKIGISNFKKCFDNGDIAKKIEANKGNDSDTVAEIIGMGVVMDIVDVLLSHLPNCEHELFALLADLTGEDIKTLQDLPMAEFFELIVTVIKDDEFKDFFKVAVRQFK